MLKRALFVLRSVVLRRRLEREMQEEMAYHLDRTAELLMARGLSPEEARREARREFGNLAYLQEETRLARGTGWIDALAADCRFALRQFARRPGTTLVMFGVLAVGMSVATLLFSFVHSYMVQPPMAVERADDLVRIRGSQDNDGDGRRGRTFSEEELGEYRAMTGHFAAVAGWTDIWLALDAGDEAERRGLEAKITFVTENYFSVVGVRPALGPGLPASADPAGGAVAVISHKIWDQLFARSPGVIGSTVSVNGVPVTIAGVAPERFAGLAGNAGFQLWIPLSAHAVMPKLERRFRAAARLRPGVTVEEAAAAVRVVAVRAAAAEAARARAGGGEDEVVRPSAEVVPLLEANGEPDFDREVRILPLGMGFLALLVLLVACTNVSALLTGVAAARRQEIAIRLSLGAGRGRILRQLLTESALLAVGAAAAALGIVALVLETVDKLGLLGGMQMEVTWPVAAFTFGVALAVGVAFGLSPALHATRLAIAGALRDSSATIAASRARLQRGLVVAQIAFTMPLVALLSAMLLVLAYEYRQRTHTEVSDRVVWLSLRTWMPSAAASATLAEAGAQERAALRRLAERLRATPGVETAVLQWWEWADPAAYFVDPADRAGGEAPSQVDLFGERVEAGYLGTVGIPLVRGRDLRPDDVRSGETGPEEAPVVIGADLARTLWGGAEPLGRRLRAAREDAQGVRTLVVVGVVDDPKAATRKPGDGYRIFLPPDTTTAPMGLLLRTAGPAEPLVSTLRETTHKELPGTVVRVQTFAQMEEAQRKELRMVTGGFLAAGLTALLLSAIGLYAVVAFSVGQRTAEIAVRIAVGARAEQIARRFVADGLRLSAIGLAIGLPISLLGLRAMMSVDDALPPVPLSSVTAMVAAGVVTVALAATWLPSRRAAAVDPARVLRGE